jgi:DNA-binding transcriptional regulator YiaG
MKSWHVLDIPVPAGFSLKVLADRVIPGGVEVLLALGWLSGDERARAVRDRWLALPRQVRRNVRVEDVCRAVGIDVAEYFGIVVATAFEFGMDVAGFISGVDWMIARIVAAANRVMGTDRSRSKSQPVPTPAVGFGRRTRLLSAAGCRDAMPAQRRQWNLSEQQFAKVLGASLRTVKYWEAGESVPQQHQRWILELLRRYTQQHGVRELRRRFVGEQPRYAKAGRPQVTRRTP